MIEDCVEQAESISGSITEACRKIDDKDVIEKLHLCDIYISRGAAMVQILRETEGVSTKDIAGMEKACRKCNVMEGKKVAALILGVIMEEL